MSSDLISRQYVIDLIRSMYPSSPIFPSARRKWEEEYEPFIRVEREISNLPSTQADLIATIQIGIEATDADDAYSCGMRNGMKWCKSLIDGKEPLYEKCPSAQPGRLTNDDFETIRIHLHAYKESLCYQRRFEEAEEFQRIIDRFMAFATAQEEKHDE